MAGEELRVLNLVLPNESREGVLMRVREIDAATALEAERKRKAEADLQEMQIRAEEEIFFSEYPKACEDALTYVAAKKVGVNEKAIKAISLEDKRNLARMLYEKQPKFLSMVRRVLRFLKLDEASMDSWFSFPALSFLTMMSVFLVAFIPMPDLLKVNIIGLLSVGGFLGFTGGLLVSKLWSNLPISSFLDAHERFLEIEKKMLAEKSEDEKRE